MKNAAGYQPGAVTTSAADGAPFILQTNCIQGNSDLTSRLTTEWPHLAPVVVPPSVDGSGTAPRKRPVFRPPVKPEEKLSIVIGREDGVVLVVQGEVLAVRRHLDDLLPDFDAERLE